MLHESDYRSAINKLQFTNLFLKIIQFFAEVEKKMIAISGHMLKVDNVPSTLFQFKCPNFIARCQFHPHFFCTTLVNEIRLQLSNSPFLRLLMLRLLKSSSHFFSIRTADFKKKTFVKSKLLPFQETASIITLSIS